MTSLAELGEVSKGFWNRAAKSGYRQGSRISDEARQAKLQQIAEKRVAINEALKQEMASNPKTRGVLMGAAGLPKKKPPNVSKRLPSALRNADPSEYHRLPKYAIERIAASNFGRVGQKEAGKQAAGRARASMKSAEIKRRKQQFGGDEPRRGREQFLHDTSTRPWPMRSTTDVGEHQIPHNPKWHRVRGRDEERDIARGINPRWN